MNSKPIVEEFRVPVQRLFPEPNTVFYGVESLFFYPLKQLATLNYEKGELNIFCEGYELKNIYHSYIDGWIFIDLYPGRDLLIDDTGFLVEA